MKSHIKYIPLDECKHGFLYRIIARNLKHGIFNKSENGFIGIRTKFNSRFLDTEYHWDNEPLAFATVKPIKEIEKVPDGLIIKDYLDDEEMLISNKISDKNIAANIRPHRNLNKNLFNYLEKFEVKQENTD